MKCCTSCKEIKHFKYFYKGKGYKDGYRSTCKDCVKKYQEDNKESKKEYLKNYKNKNKNTLKEKNKEYRIKNIDRIKDWRSKNQEYLKKYRQNNKLNFRLYIKRRSENEPIFKFKNNIRRLILHSFKRGGKNFKKIDRTEVILGCTVEYFLNHISEKFKEGMGFENHGEWHIDHIIPLAFAKTEEEVVKLNHYTNFQPLWAKENLSKGKKILYEQEVK
jgi:hypothetical protein